MAPSAKGPYMTRGLPPPPEVSQKTIPMAGLLVDVYGLEELPVGAGPTTCLWLLHPRLGTRARMLDIASRTVYAYNEHIKGQQRQEQQQGQEAKRGLLALTFDMPNHGSRLVSDRGNHAWDEGNDSHAIDMLGMVKGGRTDMSGLMDLVGGHLGREVDGHLVLGWSLGGHAAWQAWANEERVDAAVAVIGCPDFMSLMSERASKAGLDYKGTDFLGSSYFPASLIRAAETCDPKARLFSTSPLPTLPLAEEERARLAALLDAKGLRGPRGGKPLLLLSGQKDQLVPYKFTEPFVQVLKAVGGGVAVEDCVYEGVGHSFSADMVKDAVAFLVKATMDGPRREEAQAKI